MKKIFALIIPILIIFSIIQSSAQTKFVEHKIGHYYYIEIPDYMSKTLELNSSASCQYSNVNKQAYMIVIEDSKEDLDLVNSKFTSPIDFYEDFIKSFSKNKEDVKVTDPKNLIINGNKAVQSEMTANVDSTDIYYLVTVIETKTYFYKILCWTVPESKDALKNDFIKMSSTLKD